MKAPPKIVPEVDERSTARMHVRLNPTVKQTIQRAAALSGVDASVFAINAAYRAALETISTHERTVLAPEDHEAFFTALDSPAPPTEYMRKAFKRYHERYSSQ